MVYLMRIDVDGGCRNNGRADAIGAAAAVLHSRSAKLSWNRAEALPDDPTPTNQRAELAAIILGLQWALDEYDNLNSSPALDLVICSDSKYTIGCMNEWIYKWSANGWTNARGEAVANQDLIRRASDLDDEVRNIGQVQYIWVPRAENQLADKYCNQKLDEMEESQSNSTRPSWNYSDSDSD